MLHAALCSPNRPFLGRPLPLPVLDLRSLPWTLPFGLFGSPAATSPGSEKDSLVELRDEDLRWRRLALALSRASCRAFSWGVQLPFISTSLSSSSPLYGGSASPLFSLLDIPEVGQNGDKLGLQNKKVCNNAPGGEAGQGWAKCLPDGPQRDLKFEEADGDPPQEIKKSWSRKCAENELKINTKTSPAWCLALYYNQLKNMKINNK